MRFLIRVLTVLAIAGLAFVFVRHSPAAADTDESAESPVPIVQIASVDVPPTTVTRTLTSVAQPAEDAAAAFLVGGRVVELTVDVGDLVTAGDPIAILDDRPYRNARDAADALADQTDAELEQAIADRERAERLSGLNATTDEEVEQRELAVEALDAAHDARRAEVRETRRRIDETTLYAPVSGTITDRLVEVGTVVDAGSPVLIIRSVEAVEVPVDVPEALVANIEVGDSVQLDAPLAGIGGQGRVVRVARAPQAHRALYRVVVEPIDAAFRPGMTVSTTFETPVEVDAVVPATAILSPSGDRTWLLRVSDGQIEEIEVTDLVFVGERIGLRGAVAPGDLVVIRGHSGLSAGDDVTVAGEE